MKPRYKIYNLISCLLLIGKIAGILIGAITGNKDWILLVFVFFFLEWVFKLFPYCPHCQNRVFKRKNDLIFWASLTLVPKRCEHCGYRYDGKYAKRAGSSNE